MAFTFLKRAFYIYVFLSALKYTFAKSVPKLNFKFLFLRVYFQGTMSKSEYTTLICLRVHFNRAILRVH